MSRAKYSYKVQDPLVFANCFRRTHFARQVIEGVFRQKVRNINSENLIITDFLKDDGEIGYAAVFKDLQFPGNLKASVAFTLDMSAKAPFTARKVSSSLFADSYGESIFIITFTSRVPSVTFTGSVLKFTMCDIVGNRLCDLRWEYFVCCDHGDKIDSGFLVSLCKMLRGGRCNNDDCQIIEDVATLMMPDMEAHLHHSVTAEMIDTMQAKLTKIRAEVSATNVATSTENLDMGEAVNPDEAGSKIESVV